MSKKYLERHVEHQQSSSIDILRLGTLCSIPISIYNSYFRYHDWLIIVIGMQVVFKFNLSSDNFTLVNPKMIVKISSF